MISGLSISDILLAKMTLLVNLNILGVEGNMIMSHFYGDI